MIPLQYPITWELPSDPDSDVETDRLCHVFTPTDYFPGDMAIARVFEQEYARRIAAALNATRGLPTELLESGVILIPYPVGPTRHLY